MAYRNQNYMTNRKIKEEVDKNQKQATGQEEGSGQQQENKKGNLTFNVSRSSQVLSGASIVLKQDGTQKYNTTSNNEGVATISDVDVGAYTYTVTREHCVTIEDVAVNVTEGNQTINVSLQGDGTSFVVDGPTMIEEEGEW